MARRLYSKENKEQNGKQVDEQKSEHTQNPPKINTVVNAQVTIKKIHRQRDGQRSKRKTTEDKMEN